MKIYGIYDKAQKCHTRVWLGLTDEAATREFIALIADMKTKTPTLPLDDFILEEILDYEKLEKKEFTQITEGMIEWTKLTKIHKNGEEEK